MVGSWWLGFLFACGRPPSDVHFAVLGLHTGDLEWFHATCTLHTIGIDELPWLELTLFPNATRGSFGPPKDHPTIFTVTLEVPAPPTDGTRTGAWGSIGSVSPHTALLDPLADSTVTGAVTYSQGLPAGDRCGGDIDCRVQEREVFVHHLLVPRAEHVGADGETYTLVGEVTDLHLYCLDELLAIRETP